VQALTTDAELAKWFQGLDLYLMSSTAWESQPNSLLEAIAIGCPVLVSDFVDLDFDLPNFNKYDAISPTNLVSAIQKYGDIEKSIIIDTAEELKSKVGSIYSHDLILEKWLKITEI
jgi:glycosyltransferase involved in cell wall biosynthesis